MIKNYYEDYWKTEKLEKTDYFLWIRDRLLELELKGKTFLDIGCGDGFLASNFVKKFETYGIDISEIALKKAENLGIKTEVIDLNTEKLSSENEFFDIVSCFEVLEHLLDPVGVIKEINRVLKINGLFIVSVPNILNIINRMFFLLGNFTDVMDVAHKNNEIFSEHIKIFSQDKLEKLLKTGHFEVLERHYFFPKKFNEPRWKKVQVIGNLINKLKVPEIMPKFFALGFLYICKKKTCQFPLAGF